MNAKERARLIMRNSGHQPTPFTLVNDIYIGGCRRKGCELRAEIDTYNVYNEGNVRYAVPLFYNRATSKSTVTIPDPCLHRGEG